MVRDHGSLEDGGEVQGTVAAEQASGRTSFNTKHLLGQHITSCSAVLHLFQYSGCSVCDFGQFT